MSQKKDSLMLFHSSVSRKPVCPTPTSQRALTTGTHVVARFRGVSRVRTYVDSVLAPELVLKHGIGCVAQVPRPTRMVVHSTSRRYVDDRRQALLALAALELMTGHKAAPVYSRQSVAAFKLREGQFVGSRVSLRGAAVYDFLETFVTVVLPRLREFEGLHYATINTSGRVALGITHTVAFPELEHQAQLFENLGGLHIELVASPGVVPAVCATLYRGLQLAGDLSR